MKKRLNINARFLHVLIKTVALVVLYATVFGFFMEAVFRVVPSPEKKITPGEWTKKYATYNQYGFRDFEYPVKKDENVFRILIFGGSQAFGMGINRLEDTYPKLLESYLNEGLNPPRFEVINLSVPGGAADTSLYKLFNYGFYFQPDMVLLEHYMPRMPPLVFSDCSDKDVDIYPKGEVLTILKSKSVFYPFLKFRVNRLLEWIGGKRTASDCINDMYNSRSWQMQEIYLDTFVATTRIKEIKLSLFVIPVMHKLGEHHPLANPHFKIAQYCKSRQVECLDFYRTVKNRGVDELIQSRSDRHLNEAGAELAAKTLYERLKPLKTYKHLAKINKAFTLNELLEDNDLPRFVDERYLDVKQNDPPLKTNGNRKELLVWKNNGLIYIGKKTFGRASMQPLRLSQTALDQKGNFVEAVVKIFDADAEQTISKRVLKHKPESYLYTFPLDDPIKGTAEKKFLVLDHERENYEVTLRLDDPIKGASEKKNTYTLERKQAGHLSSSIEISPNVYFLDPKVIELKIFNEAEPEMENSFLGTLVALDRGFPRFIRWSAYAASLADEIIKRQPSKAAVQAAEKFKSHLPLPENLSAETNFAFYD